MADRIIDSAISRQKKLEEVEWQRVTLEKLSSKREELEEALRESEKESKCWTASSKASFFLFEKDEASACIRSELRDVETELRDCCHAIKNATKK